MLCRKPITLEPCPFCGGKAGLCLRPRRPAHSIWVQCTECGASGPIVRELTIPAKVSSEEAAIFAAERWNRRTK